LARWYLDLVERGESPERILATTFTRKAAGEIQSRVFRTLALDVLEQGPRSPSPRSPDKAAAMLRRMVLDQHRLTILTLDSFFNRIARSFCYELGLQPNWQIAQGPDVDRMQQEALAAMLQGQSSKRIAEIIRDINRGALRQSVGGILRRSVQRFQMLWRSSPPQAWSWIQQSSQVSPEEWSTALADLRKLSLPRIKDGSKVHSNWEKAHNRLLTSTENRPPEAKTWLKLLSSGVIGAVLKGEANFSRVPISDQMRLAHQPIIAQARAVVTAEIARELAALYEFISAYEQHYQEAVRRTNSLTFDDLKSLLATAKFRGATDEIYYRLDSRIHHLLLDEFQDTAREQWEIVRPIADEIMAQPGMERSLLVVGDTKQAIYGWRGGVAEIFDHLDQVWPHLENEQLVETYRCAPVVVEAVNSVFAALSHNSALTNYQQTATEWSERFERHSAKDQSKAGYLRMELLDCEQDELLEDAAEGADYEEQRKDPIPRIVADRCAEIIAELSESSSVSTIAVLVRRNGAVAQMRHTLQHFGIDCSEEGGNPLTDSAAVMVILALLRLVDHPADRLAQSHLLNSPLAQHDLLVGLADSGALVARRVRERLQRVGYGVFLDNLVSRPLQSGGSFLAAWSEREQQRLLQLVALGGQYDSAAGGGGQPGTTTLIFRRLVASSRVEDNSAQRVRVMTIHQAKGLEFDAVVLPELDYQLVKTTGDALVYRRSPLEPPERISRSVSLLERQLVPELDLMARSAEEMQLKEQLSLIYVALTRAVHALYLVCGIKEGSERTPGIQFKSGSWGLLLHNALAHWGIDPEARLIEHGDSRWWSGLVQSGESSTAEDQPVATLVQASGAVRSPRLKRVSPSVREHELGTDSTVVDHSSETGRDRQEALRFGSTVHQELENIEWLDNSAVSISEEIAQMIAQPAVREILSREHYQRQWPDCDEIMVRRELPFSSCDTSEPACLVVGAIDRLVLGLHSGKVVRAQVIDFKTDNLHPDGHAEAALRYVPQLAMYREAVGRLFALDLSKIETCLVFVRDGTVSDLKELI